MTLQYRQRLRERALDAVIDRYQAGIVGKRYAAIQEPLRILQGNCPAARGKSLHLSIEMFRCYCKGITGRIADAMARDHAYPTLGPSPSRGCPPGTADHGHAAAGRLLDQPA